MLNYNIVKHGLTCIRYTGDDAYVAKEFTIPLGEGFKLEFDNLEEFKEFVNHLRGTLMGYEKTIDKENTNKKEIDSMYGKNIFNLEYVQELLDRLAMDNLYNKTEIEYLQKYLSVGIKFGGKLGLSELSEFEAMLFKSAEKVFKKKLNTIFSEDVEFIFSEESKYVHEVENVKYVVQSVQLERGLYLNIEDLLSNNLKVIKSIISSIVDNKVALIDNQVNNIKELSKSKKVVVIQFGNPYKVSKYDSEYKKVELLSKYDLGFLSI